MYEIKKFIAQKIMQIVLSLIYIFVTIEVMLGLIPAFYLYAMTIVLPTLAIISNLCAIYLIKKASDEFWKKM